MITDQDVKAMVDRQVQLNAEHFNHAWTPKYATLENTHYFFAIDVQGCGVTVQNYYGQHPAHFCDAKEILIGEDFESIAVVSEDGSSSRFIWPFVSRVDIAHPDGREQRIAVRGKPRDEGKPFVSEGEVRTEQNGRGETARINKFTDDRRVDHSPAPGCDVDDWRV